MLLDLTYVVAAAYMLLCGSHHGQLLYECIREGCMSVCICASISVVRCGQDKLRVACVQRVIHALIRIRDHVLG